MRFKEHLIASWATTFAGIAAMAISLIGVWQQWFDFVWEGIGGLIIGTLLLIAPRTIESLVMEALKSWGKRGGNDYYSPYNPVEPQDPNQPVETLKDE